MIFLNNSYYGGYRTQTFAEIFPSAAVFTTFLEEECDIPLAIKPENTELLYGLLYARYGNSHHSGSDPHQFMYGVASTIFMYGPSWEKRLEVQKELRELSLEELQKGTKDIHNSAYNPGTRPTTATIEELPGINSQNTTNRKKSKAEAYAMLMAVIETDVTREFIDKFAELFIKVAEPDTPLLYETTAEELLILGGN